MEEIVSRNYIVRDKPDVVINCVDATNLERNLYLTLQLLELGRPTVVALNMGTALLPPVFRNGGYLSIFFNIFLMPLPPTPPLWLPILPQAAANFAIFHSCTTPFFG